MGGRERETREGERAAMNGLSVRTGRANGMPTQAGVSRTTTATRVSHQRQARKVCLQRRRTIECSATAEAEKTANLSKYAPVGGRYLVTRYVEEAKTDGGILLSASAAENKAAGEKLLIGIVHSVPEAEEGSSPAEIKEGTKFFSQNMVQQKRALEMKMFTL